MSSRRIPRQKEHPQNCAGVPGTLPSADQRPQWHLKDDGDDTWVCFVTGTLFETENGPVTVEDLAIGDTVPTLSNGPQVIRWIGSTSRTAKRCIAPIRVKAGALSAKHLINDNTITVAHDLEEFDYFHILFDAHEIIMPNGAPSESFQLDAEILGALDQETRDEILELFPELMDSEPHDKQVRLTLSPAEAALLH